MPAYAPRSRMLLASMTCAAAIACGGAGDDDPNGMPGAPDGGQMVASDSGSPMGGQVGGGQTGGGQTGGGQTGGGQTGGGDAGTPVVDAGPVDLGEDSKGDTFFRADTLVLRAPNVYATLLFKIDVTTDANNSANTVLTTDENADGFVDMSLLLRFLKTSDPKGANGNVTTGGAMCQMPLGPDKPCGPDKTFPFQAALTHTNSTQACVLTGTQEMAAAPCFSTAPASLTLQLPILGAVPLQDGQIIGTWEGANISNGRVRGFLPKTVAKATKLGEGVPPILAPFGIKTGAELAALFSDAQLQKNDKGEDGWWILMNYTAKPASFDPALKVP